MKYNSGVNNSMRRSKPAFEGILPKIGAISGNISRKMSPVKKSKIKNKDGHIGSEKSKAGSFSKSNSVSPVSRKLFQKKSATSICDAPKSGNSAYRAKSLGAKAPRTQKSDQTSDDATQKEHAGISKISPSKMVRRLSACSDERQSPSRNMPVYDDTRKFLDIVIDGELSRLNFCDRIDVVTLEELVTQAAFDTPQKETAAQTSRQLQKRKVELTELMAPPVSSEPVKRLNEAVVTVLSDYAGQVKADESWQAERRDGYYRYFETTAEELDEEVEYDMDEEDVVWLEQYNGYRHKQHKDSLTEEAFEFVIDRLEKEMHYIDQAKTSAATKKKGGGASGRSSGVYNDEDAVCSICLDDECQNLNAILFCDRCNLAVHQDCYGVPYVPEGEWLCRKCQRSPTQTIHCCLCPRTDGAMKQTDDGGWCHVLCALWIPEVGFGSVESLEPITKIDKVPSARRKLTCSICKKREEGASIQCMKKNCYTAFHVSCAQQIGIYMKIEPVHDDDGAMVNVHKTILCNAHRPADSKPFEPMIDNSIDSDPEQPSDTPSSKGKVKVKVKNNRLDFGSGKNEKKGTGKKSQAKGKEGSAKDAPVIPLERLTDIADSLVLSDRYQVVATVRNYWKLKRSSRNGMALLRRLQTSTNTITCDVHEVVDKRGDGAVEEAVSGLVALRKLRNEFEKVRLLLELIRKREKLKRELAQQHVKIVQLQITPCAILLYDTLEQLQAKDEGDIFARPVNIREIPDYLNVIKKPMDFSTMRSKIDGNMYCDLRELEKDFNLMIKNCIKFNARDTAYYRLAIKLRKKGHKILAAARALEDGPATNSESTDQNPDISSTMLNASNPSLLSHHSALDDSSDDELESPKKKKTYKKVLQNKNKIEKNVKPKAALLKVPKKAKIAQMLKTTLPPSKAKAEGKRPVHSNSYKSWISNKRKKLKLQTSVDDVVKTTPQQKKNSDTIGSSKSKSPKKKPTVKPESGPRPSERSSRTVLSDSIVVKSTKRTRSQESLDILSTPPSRVNTVKRRKLSLDVEERERGQKGVDKSSLSAKSSLNDISSKSLPIGKRTRRLAMSVDCGDIHTAPDRTKLSPSSTEKPRYCVPGLDEALQSSSSIDSSPQRNGSVTPTVSKHSETRNSNHTNTTKTKHKTDLSKTINVLASVSSSKDDAESVNNCNDIENGLKANNNQDKLASESPVNNHNNESEPEDNDSDIDRSGAIKIEISSDVSDLAERNDSSTERSNLVDVGNNSDVSCSSDEEYDSSVDKSGLSIENDSNIERSNSYNDGKCVNVDHLSPVNKNDSNLVKFVYVEKEKRSKVYKSAISENDSDVHSSAVGIVLPVAEENQEDTPPVLSRCPSPMEEEEATHPHIERYDSVEEEATEDRIIPANPPTLIKSDNESTSTGETGNINECEEPPQLMLSSRDTAARDNDSVEGRAIIKFDDESASVGETDNASVNQREEPPELIKSSSGENNTADKDCVEVNAAVTEVEPPLLVKSNVEISEGCPELTSIQQASIQDSSCNIADTMVSDISDGNSCSDLVHSAPPQLHSVSDSFCAASDAAESIARQKMPAGLSPHLIENSDSTCTSDSSCESHTETLADKQPDICRTKSSSAPRSGLFDRFSVVLDSSVVVTETDSSYGSANSDSEQSRSKCNSPEYQSVKVDCSLVRPPINNNLMTGSESSR